MEKAPANVLDDVVEKVVQEAHEEAVEEVVESKEAEETGRTENGRMAGTSMFGSYKPSKETRKW